LLGWINERDMACSMSRATDLLQDRIVSDIHVAHPVVVDERA